MTPKERLIDQLRQLCIENGGPERVAVHADISAENLKQILVGTKLPSGEPRGVGPRLQRALERAYPGWAEERKDPRHSHPDFVSTDPATGTTSFVEAKQSGPSDEPRVTYFGWPANPDTQARIKSLPPERLWALENVVRAFLGAAPEALTRMQVAIQAVAAQLTMLPEDTEAQRKEKLKRATLALALARVGEQALQEARALLEPEPEHLPAKAAPKSPTMHATATRR